MSMTKNPKLTEETECWVCHRKAKDIIEMAKNAGYGAIGDIEATEKGKTKAREQLNSSMLFIEIMNEIKLPCCCICCDLLTEISEDQFLDRLEAGALKDQDKPERDIITKSDLKHLHLVVTDVE